MQLETVDDNPTKIYRLKKRYVFVGLLIILLVILAPRIAKDNTTVLIKEGASLTEISNELMRVGLIWSETEFKIMTKLLGSSRDLKAGTYIFSGFNTTFSIMERLRNADYRIPEIKITVVEGLSNREIEELMIKNLSYFNAEEFRKIAASYEGYLFPDTYTFYQTAGAGEVVKKMNDNYKNKIEPLLPQIKKSKHSEKELVTMASILEIEANNPTDRRMIAGILWKRISIGMPLQVDAVFPYILGKNTFEVSLHDLKVNSPYNTYINKGLPPGPISNPGLDSIEAALAPKRSDYLYYLSDRNGIMHYAKSFTEHVKNKQIYLK